MPALEEEVRNARTARQFGGQQFTRTTNDEQEGYSMKNAYTRPELVVYGRIEQLTQGSGGSKWDLTITFNGQAISGIGIGGPGSNGGSCSEAFCTTVNYTS